MAGVRVGVGIFSPLWDYWLFNQVPTEKKIAGIVIADLESKVSCEPET